MWDWSAVLCQLNLDLTAFAAGLVFLLPLRHRRRFPLRTALCLAVWAGVSLGFSALSAAAGPTAVVLLHVLRLALFYLMLPAMGTFCVHCTTSAAIYCGVWAMITHQLLHEIWLVLCPLLDAAASCGWLMDLWFLAAYVALGLTVARWMPEQREYHVGPRQTALSVLMVLLSAALYELSFYFTQSEGAMSNLSLPRVIVALVQFYCVTVFYLQSVLFQKSAMRQELMALNLLWQQSRAQYGLSKENIDLINRKCHDLKHQMAALKTMTGGAAREQYVSELENSIQIYDSIVKTGNEALDTILTEKSLYCEANQILINCVADGSRLDFIHPVDLYAIFGNALSNAIECVEQIDDPARRVIDVLVYVKRQLLSITITNPLAGELTFEGGLPITTKERNGYHGFGLKSIRHTAEKYGGFVTVEGKDGSFSLRVLFPLPA